MIVVHVHVHVKPEYVDEFIQATLENAQRSLNEPGIVRFDVIQRVDDPAKFILVEVYRNEEATLQHKETEHYKKWRDTVAPMMAEPRSSVRFRNIFPADSAW